MSLHPPFPPSPKAPACGRGITALLSSQTVAHDVTMAWSPISVLTLALSSGGLPGLYVWL